MEGPKPEKIKEVPKSGQYYKIQQVESVEELIKLLENIEGIHGSKRFYSGPELSERVSLVTREILGSGVLEPGALNFLLSQAGITDGDGLRSKVIELIIKEKSEK